MTRIQPIDLKRRLRGLLGALLFAALAPVAAAAQMMPGPLERGAPGPDGGPMRVDLASQGAAGQSLSLATGKSAIVDLPVDARDVLVTSPAIADVVLRSPRRIYIVGVKPGVTDAAFFDAFGHRILGLNIMVNQDASAIAQAINNILPGARVSAEGINNSVILSGHIATEADADKAVQIATQFTTNPNQVVDMLSVGGKEQVMLKVRIVEVQRSVIKQLGFNLSATLGQVGSPQFIAAAAATYGVNGALLGGLSGAFSQNTTQEPETMAYDPATKAYDLPIVCPTCSNSSYGGNGKTISTVQTTAGSTGLNQANGAIQAFEQVGLVRTLAEPNLTAVSGESAKFLAGGEFPVPVSQSNTGQISVDFKEYGIGLGFTPIVLSGGRISLKVSTEVSQLTAVGGFTLPVASTAGGSNTAALTIPGLTVRRAQTVVELPSGGSMMIAGLLNEQTKEDIASLPGLMNLPVLGSLFRSRDYQEGETELVVIVTPYLVNPANQGALQTPADGLQIANDSDTILLGRLNKVTKAPSAAVAGRTYEGPVGYVIE